MIGEFNELYYRKVTRETIFWHGTGRYRYDKKFNKVDILNNITDYGIKPYKDYYNFINPGIKTISLAKNRYHALPYADMHQKYKKIGKNRSYKMTDFVKNYIQYSGEEMQKEIQALNLPINDISKLMKEQNWSKKINKSSVLISDAFLGGTDISRNFPILIGVREVPTIKDLARYLAEFEVRSLDNMAIDKTTHLEVPRSKIIIVQMVLLFKGVNIPVFAIEDIEYKS